MPIAPKFLVLLRKQASNILFGVALLFLFLYPDARPWLMQRMFDAGLFKARMETALPKEKMVSSFPNLVDAQGRAVSPNTFQNKVVLINFWAPWCPPCRAEMPSLQHLYKELEHDPRFVILLVDMDGDQQKAGAFLQRKEITIPNFSISSAVDKALFSGTLPTTVVLAPGGKLVWKHEGLANYANPDFRKQLADLVALSK